MLATCLGGDCAYHFCHNALSPPIDSVQSFDYCLEVRLEIVRTFVCCIVYDSNVHSDMHMLVNLRVGLSLNFVFVCLFRFTICF